MRCFTAQRVKSRTGEVGINRYRYALPDLLSDAPHVWTTIERHPGVLETFEYAVKPPGNNAVISYLDILTPDAMTAEQLAQVLWQLDGYIALAELPIQKKIDEVQVRFGAILALEGEAARREFHELARAAVRLVPKISTAAAAVPFVLLARRDPDGVTYRLDEASRQRLGAPETSVKLSSDVHSELGDVLPEVALLLTRLTSDELMAAGGARILDASSQEVVANWPRRPS